MGLDDNNLDDDELHRRFVETGECEYTLKLLMQRYEKSVRACVLKILNDPRDADEVTNETFRKAFINKGKIKYPDKLEGWLHTIAKNAAFDYVRGRKDEDGIEIVSLDDKDGKNIAAATLFEEQQVQQTEAMQYQLNGLLRLLSEKDQEIVDYIRDDLRPKQIAEKIDFTPSAVQKRRERLLEWLRPVADQLDELLDDLPPQDQKVMERHLDGQPIEEISRSLVITPTDIETCVKRVIREWKKTVRSNTT
ncbi:sigma-70 family RNA polymerase sigma factor [Candidatus Poribacteria bacterium]|nr:sigma-70 family RNA polymerase sigma factor [Candidatus Poribacteria bacterium]